MNLDTSTWKPFKLSDLFDIRKGKRLTKFDQTEGGTPYIGAVDSNNGVSGHIGQEPIHDGGTISVSYNGSVAEAFYQPAPYWATDDVNVLYPRDFKLTPATALFICTVIRLEKYRFNYGRKWHLERMREAVIRLPSTQAGAPDWLSMQSFIEQLPAYRLKALSESGLGAPATTPLDTRAWKPFKYTDLFDIVRGKGPSLADAKDNPGPVPYVTASDKNNGISAWTMTEDCHPPGCLTVATNGSVGECFFQEAAFQSSSDVAILVPRTPTTAAAMLFLATLIRREGKFKYGYGRKWGLQRMKESTVLLPVTPAGTPDFAAMEEIVKGLPAWKALSGATART